MTKRPFSIWPPAGVCIQELATRIQKADIDPPSATIAVAKRCMARGTRSQPNIMMPRKPASSMKAMAPSKPRILPKKPPANRREGRPIRAELEFERQAGDDPDAEIQEEQPAPEAGLVVPDDIAGSRPERFRDDQEKRQADRQHRPENMEQRRDRELQARESDDDVGWRWSSRTPRKPFDSDEAGRPRQEARGRAWR